MENTIFYFIMGVSTPAVFLFLLWLNHKRNKNMINEVFDEFKKNYPALLNKVELDKLFFELSLYSTREDMFMAIDATVAYKELQLSKEGV